MKNTSSTGSVNFVIFDQTNVITEASSFNITTGIFTVPSSPFMYCLYWMNVAVEVAAYTQASITINSYFKITKNHTSFNNKDIVNRAGIVRLQSGSRISMISTYPTLTIYWSTFRLDNTFNPLIAFSVGSSTSINGLSRITFDQIFINEGGAWNSAVNVFVTPKKGIYFFSFSGGVSANQKVTIYLMLNESVVSYAGGSMNVLISSGIDLLSKSHLMQLNIGDIVSTKIQANEFLFSDPINYQTGFSGFFYSPVSGLKVNYNKRLSSSGSYTMRSAVSYAIENTVQYSAKKCLLSMQCKAPAIKYSAVQSTAEQFTAVQCNALLHNTVGTVLSSAVFCNPSELL